MNSLLMCCTTGLMILVFFGVSSVVHADDNIGKQKALQSPPNKSDTGQVQLTEREKAWIREHPEIRVGVDHYPPFEIVDDKGNYEGLGAEYLDRIGKNTGLNFKILIGLTWAQVQEGAKNGTVDVIPVISETIERSKFLLFTEGYLHQNQAVITRLEHPAVKGIADLKGKTMAVSEGYSEIEDLNRSFPSIKQMVVRNPLDELKLVSSGQADACQGNIAVLSYYMIKHNMHNLKVAGPSNIGGGGTMAMGVRKDWPMLHSILKKGLKSIDKAERIAISRKWTPGLGDAEDTSLDLTVREKAWLKAHPVIRVMGETDYPPWDFVVDGKPVGYGVDYVNLLADRLGLELEFVIAPLSELIEKTANRELDLMHTAYSDMHEKILTSKSYGRYFSVPFILDGRTDIQFVADLKGKRVALVKGDAVIKILKKAVPEAHVVEYISYRDAMLAVAGKHVDATVMDYAVGKYLIREHLLQRLKSIGEVRAPGDIPYQYMRLGVRSDWPELLTMLEKAMDSITDRELAALDAKWLEEHRKSAPQVQLTHEERSWFEKHPVITLGADIKWPPFQMVDENGQFYGLDADYMRLLEQKTGLKIKVEPQLWSQAVDRAKRHEIDGLAAAVITDDRKKHLNFTNVYFVSPTAVYIRNDDDYLDSLEELNGRVLAIEEGSSHLKFVEKNYPEIKILKTPDVLTALISVSNGKSDGAYGVLGVINHLSDSHMITNLKPGYVHFDEKEGQFRVAVRNNVPLFVSILNKGIAAITEREHRQIRKKWLGDDASIRGFETLRLTNKERTWLKAHPSICLGFNPDMQPLLIHDPEGENFGILPEIFRELEALTGLDVDIKVGPWHEIIKQAEQGEIDGLLLCVPELAKAIGLKPTRKYISTIPVVFGKRDARFAINSIDDLKGKRVAHLRAVKFIEDILAPIKTKTTVIETDSIIAAMTMVLEDKADVVLGMNYDTYLLNQSVLTGIEPVFIDTSKMIKTVTAVRSDWPELTGILNKGLAAIGDANINQIMGRWTRIEIPEQKISLTGSERTWLADHPIIRVAADADWAPVEFRDEKGEYHGISIEYLSRLEELIGVKLEITRDISWQDAIINVKNKKLDMFSSVAKTNEREKFALFTTPYISMPINIFARDDVSYIGNLDVLAGKKVAVVEGYAIHEWLRNNNPKIELVPFPSTPDALKKLASGDVTAYVGNIVTTSYYIGELHLNNIRVAGETPYKNDQCMAVRDDWPELVSILQKALDAIPQHERNSIYNSWMSLKYEHAFDYSLFWKIAIGVGVFFILVLAWNFQIRHQRTALRIARDAAEAANRAKNEFLANMSHELRTPLNSILGYAQILKPQKNLTEKQKTDISIIHASGEHLLSLINEILDFAKIEARKVEIEHHEFNLPAMIQHVSNLTKIQAQEKDLFFRLDEQSGLPQFVSGDQQKTTQILLNLLHNAIKYTKTGGVTFRVSYQQENQRLYCEVEDTGVGIEQDQLNKIFEPFTQVGDDRRTAAGTGLGLAISRKLVESMNGQLSVKSEIGKGSVFSLVLELPQVEETGIAFKQAETQIIGYKGERRRILIVDDNQNNLSMLSSLLESLEFKTVLAENGQEAIQEVEKKSPDLVLLDLVMPVMDGLMTARAIKDNPRLSRIKIIGVSASASDQTYKAEFVRICDSFIPKPVGIDSLLGHIMELLELEWMIEMQEMGKATNMIPKKDDLIEIKIPPAEILERLLKDAEHGFFGKISDLLEELVAEDAEYQDFCNRMNQFVAIYNDEGIIEYVTQILQ